MMLKIASPLVLTVLAVAGCAAQAPERTAAAGPEEICTREMPTGSNIAVMRCRSAEEVKREAAAGRDAADTITKSKSGIRGPAGP